MSEQHVTEVEIWKPIPGFAIAYEVSHLGRVRRISRMVKSGRGFASLSGRVCSAPLDKKGYPRVKLSITQQSVRRRIHSLVLLAFVGPRPYGLQGCHADGNKTNNRLNNLRYDTPKGNAADSIRLHAYHIGERSHSAKLTAEKVKRIRERYASGETQVSLAIEFGVNKTHLSAIVCRRKWKHI